MRLFITRHIKRTVTLLRRKTDLSFLNAAGVLLMAGVLIIPVDAGTYLKAAEQKSKKLVLQNPEYHTLTYIKPFTSLAVFNSKFRKEKTKNDGVSVFTIPMVHLKTLFKK